ncbi:UNVERIFIED_CONTAM: hypothetical protein RMT77_016619 [Armadillidium vulgare]
MLGNSDPVTKCTCGLITNPQSRIARGEVAEENEFPYQAAIHYLEMFFCSGSIINNLYILTAAHCFNRFRNKNDTSTVNIANMSVALGTRELKEIYEYKIIRQIIQVIPHENFVCTNFSNDIALMKMNEPLTSYSTKINPICLPPIGPTYEEITATVTGWGREKLKGPYIIFLRKANVRILSNFYCNVKISKTFLEDFMMCADSNISQTCQGDSGGPLMINELNKYVQIGVVSFGYGCKLTFFPDVYTRVNHYLQWIKNHTSDAKYCEN